MTDQWVPLLLAQADPGRTDFFRRWADSMRRTPRYSGLVLVSVVLFLVAAFLLLRWLAARSRSGARAPVNTN